MSPVELKSSQFRREREAAWRALETLVDRCDRESVRALNADEVIELSTLYQHAVGSLATARVVSLDRIVVEFLESLVARAHLCVYGFRQRPSDAIRTFVAVEFPEAVRRWRWFVAAAFSILLAAIVAGGVLVARDEDRYYSLVSIERAGGRTPTATTAALRKTLYDEGGGAAFELQSFATALFTHNAQVGLLCAALGVAAGLPIPPLLAATGLELGAMAQLFGSRGLGPEFWAWILPHGVTELLAVVLCSAAGLATGFAFVFPGRQLRREAVAVAGRRAGTIVLGAVGMFLIAAAIEGVFRQRVSQPEIRWAVAVGFVVLWTAYFTQAGRDHGRRTS
jgi:uncharacterized membrane protein SpoIIM required for sporulation